MIFLENNKAGQPALALILTTVKDLKVLDGSGRVERKKRGYVRHIVRVACADAAGIKNARRELLGIFGKAGTLPKGWRIASGHLV